MILRSILIVIESLCSILLILIILLQKSKSEGLGLAFGSGMGETLFGSRAGNVLTKATIVLSVVFLVNTIALAIVFSGGEKSLMQRYTTPRSVRTPQAGATRRPVDARQPAQPQSGAPTLPGVAFEEEPIPAEPAPAAVEE